MPTYEYACPKCGVFEKFQSMKDEPLPKCPTCRSKIKRLIGTGAGIIFKGSGFYQTDYRSDSYKVAAKSASTDASAPAATPTPAATPAPAAPAPAASATPKRERKAS
ncbi:MAG: zinc ribbon domain-containing protein [Kiritimatiellia bacterium]